MASSWPAARWQALSADTRLGRVCHVHGSGLGIDVSALGGARTPVCLQPPSCRSLSPLYSTISQSLSYLASSLVSLRKWVSSAGGSRRYAAAVHVARPSVVPPCLADTASCLCCIQSQPEDYEQALALLSQDIQKRQTRLSEIRLRERRATLLVSVYALVAWIAYTTLWYMDFVPNITAHKRSSSFERTTKAVPVFVGPIVYVVLLCRGFVLSAASWGWGVRLKSLGT